LPSCLVMAELTLEDILERKPCSSHVVAPSRTWLSEDFLNARIGNSVKCAGLKARTATHKIVIIRRRRDELFRNVVTRGL
jgi:hypothetical protein